MCSPLDIMLFLKHSLVAPTALCTVLAILPHTKVSRKINLLLLKTMCTEDLMLASPNSAGDSEEFNFAGHLIVFSHCMS